MARRLRGLLLLFAVLLVGCDHATKLAAHTVLQGRTLDVVPGVLDLRYAENHDTAFSLTHGLHSPYKAAFLTVLAVLGVRAVALFWWRRRETSRAQQVGYAMLLAGAVGNVADRLARGFVIDFIHLRCWPVFNVADVLIVAGIAWLGLLTLTRTSRARSESSCGNSPRA